jgi:hypothetical protein
MLTPAPIAVVAALGRTIAVLLVVSLATRLASYRPRAEATGARVDRALGAALRTLVAAQSSDGAWRSSTYGAFKDGLSLLAVGTSGLRGFFPVPSHSSALRIIRSCTSLANVEVNSLPGLVPYSMSLWPMLK